MRAFRWFWHIIFACCFGISYAQYAIYNFHKIGTEEGLSSLNVLNLEQNPNGIVHVTTENGVYLYDGYSFKLIRTDSIGKPQIIGSSVKSTDEIFLSTREFGVYEYNYKTKSGFKYNPESFKNTADQLLVKDNFIYLLTSFVKLEIINTKNNTLIEDEVKKQNKNNQAFCMLKTSSGKILLGRQNGLYEIIGDKQVKLDVLHNIPVYCIYESTNGELLVAGGSKIYILKDNLIIREISPKYPTQSNTFSSYGERNIHKVLADIYGRIWFCTYPNETLFYFENGITHNLFDEMNIAPLLINQIFSDKTGNIWLGTYDDGIYIFQNSSINNYSINYAEKNLSAAKIMLKEPYVFTATNNGLYAFHIPSGTVKTISKPDKILMEPINDLIELNGVFLYTKRSQLDLNPAMFMDQKRKYPFKPLNGKICHPLKNGQLVLCDWMANVLLVNKENYRVIDTLISFPDYRTTINSVYSSGDSLLVATGKGIYLYNFKQKKHILIEKTATLKVNQITSLNGKLFACHEEGISIINGAEEYKYIGTKALNGVKKIFFEKNHYWILTQEGLIICDEKLNPLRILNYQSGLASNIVNDIAFENETICIATSKGISITRISSLLSEKETPPPSIEYLLIENKISYFSGIPVKLNTDDNDVSLFFYSPQYTHPNKQYFKYKLDNGSWINSESNLINLPPLNGGRHILSVIVSSDNINWSSPAQVILEKEMKFTETRYSLWIIIFSSLGVASFISYLIIKRVKARAVKRIQEEQQINMLKHQAMNSLLSPHFIFNSLTSIQNYINSNNSLKASEYLAKFSRLIRMIIEKASQGQILLKDEITRLTYYLELEKERFKNKFDYVIQVDEKLDQNTVSIPNMIIQPHAENCIIHGILPKMEHGHLYIIFKKVSDNKMIITIEDDGVGLIKAKEHAKTGHKSLGTSTIKSILELNSKLTGKRQSVQMVDKSTLPNSGTGTLITIELEL